MRTRDVLFGLGAGLAAGSAAWLVYGTLVEANRLVLERRRLRLPNWPKRLSGYKVAVLADIHVRDRYTVELAARAIEMALDQEPDMVVLPGDLVGYWKAESAAMLGAVLEPLLLMGGHAVAVPGNHDYWGGTPDLLAPLCEELSIKLLRNETWTKDGICWAGIDSLNAGKAAPMAPMVEALATGEPVVALWHEPDAVDQLPQGASLMIAGHSHGGQWRFPWGWIPMKTRNGVKYVEGWHPEAPTPLYVSRGIATTGPPARLGALPEVSLLELV